jgi:hypothetical protein
MAYSYCEGWSTKFPQYTDWLLLNYLALHCRSTPYLFSVSKYSKDLFQMKSLTIWSVNN